MALSSHLPDDLLREVHDAAIVLRLDREDLVERRNLCPMLANLFDRERALLPLRGA